ncbi:putative HXXXD-type acyl-transferase family protein [Hibiscus syriacus]|uniref:HXXXD-type acyl-transferase family protein n=1 Tax=Hibiscus syriacus TaxID=106335 RepID=A0A6A2X970_HIBSY|nr:putative HXXXD-type acyl-transferase family protein [Hibiscus syriacus]
MSYGKFQLDDDDDVVVMVGLHQSSNNNIVEMYVETMNATHIPTSSVPARRTEEDDEDIVLLVYNNDTPFVDESNFFEVVSEGQGLDVEAVLEGQGLDVEADVWEAVVSRFAIHDINYDVMQNPEIIYMMSYVLSTGVLQTSSHLNWLLGVYTMMLVVNGGYKYHTYNGFMFGNAGLRSIKTDLGEGTVMHCWVPKTHYASRPNILLVHGFGANAMWQYGDHLRHFTSRFNIYVPDLIFFGESYTSRRERMESFQAQSVMKLMEAHGVRRMSLIGISYGGFVGYSMAAQFPDKMEKLVLCCAGVCLEEKDLEDGFFNVSDLDEALSILLPQKPEKLRELIKFSFVRPIDKWVPSLSL